MRILPYYIIHTFINSIKKLFKTWVAVFIAVCLCFGLIGGIVGATIGNSIEENSSYEETVDEEYQEAPITEQEKKEIIDFSRGGIALLVFIVILFCIYGGDKSGTKIFTMPDVNFLFPSPMKPQSVLLFKTVLQLGIAVVSSVYIIFQLPNLVINLGLNILACISIFIAYAFLLYYSRLTSVLTYTLTATYPRLKKYILPFVIVCIGLLIGIYFYFVKIEDLGYLKSALTICSFKPLEYIPVFGWLSGMIISCINGNIAGFICYFILNIAMMILLTVLIWRIPADFYEDAFSGANETFETLNAAQNGGNIIRKKERNEKIRRNEKMNGEGAAVFFTKTLYNRKRFSRLGIINKTSMTYLLFSFALTTLTSLLFDFKSPIPIGFTIAVLIFFRNMGNPIAAEMDKSYLYSVPEPSFKKLFYCLCSGSLETFLDLFPALLIAIIAIPEKTVHFVIWYLIWLSFDLFCSNVGLFTELILPSAIVPSIKAMIGLIIRMLTVIPGLIMLIIGCFSGAVYWYIFTVILNLLASVVLFLPCPAFLS